MLGISARKIQYRLREYAAEGAGTNANGNGNEDSNEAEPESPTA